MKRQLDRYSCIHLYKVYSLEGYQELNFLWIECIIVYFQI